MICLPLHFTLIALLSTPLVLLSQAVSKRLKSRKARLAASAAAKPRFQVFSPKAQPFRELQGSKRPLPARRLFGLLCKHLHQPQGPSPFPSPALLLVLVSPVEWAFASVGLVCFFLLSLVSRITLLSFFIAALPWSSLGIKKTSLPSKPPSAVPPGGPWLQAECPLLVGAWLHLSQLD